jgi:hypothetical protein
MSDKRHSINGRMLVGTTLLKGDEEGMSYLTDETHGRHVLVVCVKWQNRTDRQIDRRKKGLADPPPWGVV